MVCDSPNTLKTMMLIAISVLCSTRLRAETCESVVGRTFFANAEQPLVGFVESQRDGIHLNEHVADGQKFRILALVPRENVDDDLSVLTQDARELQITCSKFLEALEPAHVGQRFIPGNADEDFTSAEAAFKAKQVAAASELQRKRKSALESEAKHEREIRDYIAQRTARGGVKIGMTEQQVLNSSWGTPDKRNHTYSSVGDKEQWVYGGQYFLYFDNGVLVAIETDSPDEGYFRVKR